MTDKDLFHQLLHQATTKPALLDLLTGADDAALADWLHRMPSNARASLERALGVDHALRLIGELERRVDLGLEARAESEAPAPDPTLPAVILLPGFMGVHLFDESSDAGRVWLDPAAALRGDLSARAALDADGTADAFPGERLVPDGVVRLIYADLTRALRAARYAVHTFSFDFRRSIADSTLLLRDFVRGILDRAPGQKIVLLGHSMGALLACLLPPYLPDFAERVEQTIFLGGPLAGTFDSVESLTGTHWILPRLVWLSRGKESSLDFQGALATWPGVFSMLPDPAVFPDCNPAFDEDQWPSRVGIQQRLLAEALDLKTRIRESALFTSGAPVTQLLATRYPTIGSLALDADGKLVAGPRVRRGDGVVAASSAIAGVTAYRTTFPHTLAPVEPAAITAILALLRDNTCALPRIHAEDVEADIPTGLSPVIDMGVGLVESGAESMLAGHLTFAALAWLFTPIA
jgi:pimeloyl-ACP methyl ester carboxylesterase